MMIYEHIHMLVDDSPVTGIAFPVYKNNFFFLRFRIYAKFTSFKWRYSLFLLTIFVPISQEYGQISKTLMW